MLVMLVWKIKGQDHKQSTETLRSYLEISSCFLNTALQLLPAEPKLGWGRKISHHCHLFPQLFFLPAVFPCSKTFFDKISPPNEGFLAEMFFGTFGVCRGKLAYKAVCLFKFVYLFYLRLPILLVHCQQMKMERKLSKWQLITLRLCAHR